MLKRLVIATVMLLICSTPGSAQPSAQEPPPLWEAQVAASFVGTGGNSDTSSAGAEFTAHRRGAV